ncbi:MAG: hypothetical protein FJX34_04130 [Alphaproteobacteria bacterium]|nr:hypothetical protein [Alphaproteobacteria bacterium]
MPRAPRIEYPNAYYHVMNRGIAKNPIFYNDKSYEIFLEILGEACKKFDVVVHAYCLMNNHYHLLLCTHQANLSKFMQRISGFYTRRFNAFMERDGSIFRGRFKSILVDKDTYLLNLNRYIHRNPEALTKNLKSYKWSSYPAYLELADCPPWLNKNESLEMLSADKNKTAYEYFVETEKVSDTKVSDTFLV